MCARRHAHTCVCAPIGMCRHTPSSSALDPPVTSAAKEAVPLFPQGSLGPGVLPGEAWGLDSTPGQGAGLVQGAPPCSGLGPLQILRGKP